jgi:subtilase family serine protease
MSRTRTFARTISAGLAIAGLTIGGAGGSAGAAVQGTAAQPAVTTLAGSLAPFTSRTRATGNVAASRRLSIQLWLQTRTAAASLFAQAVSTPGNSQFHHYLSPDAYTARFAATQADANTVESWLRAAGFTAVSTGPQRSYVRATATASTISRAFDVQLKLYKSSAAVNAGTQALWSNDRPISLPTRIASLVLGVTGLDSAAAAGPLTQPPPTKARAAASAACSAYYAQHLQIGLPAHFGRTSFPTQVCGYSAEQLRAAYGANMTNTGKGETIAFTEMGPADPNMLLTLQDYARVSGLPVPSKKQYSARSGGTGCGDDASGREEQPGAGAAFDIEEQMDIEAAYAMAPGANELEVDGLSCGGSDPVMQGLLNAVTAVLGGSGHHPLASIVSNSWESDPEGQTASVTKVEHADLLQAAAEGVGMYFASGDDSGVNAPASDPYAIAVGGTTLGIGKTGNRLFETGWSDAVLGAQKGKWVNEGELGASGGGPSALWKQPAYQKGIVPAALSRSPGHSGLYRSVPDISADADPATAMAVGMLTVVPGKKPVFFLTPGGGTSEATPLVAGLVAAAQQGMKVPFGFLNPVLYTLAGTSALHDVLPLTATTPSLYRGAACDVATCGVQALTPFDVQSTNESAGFTGQVTLKGYDNMSGLGAPAGQSFITALRALETAHPCLHGRDIEAKTG